jgi:transposase InsO family protein
MSFASRLAIAISALVRDYNEVRPHSAIGNQVPATLHRSTGNPGQAVAR